MKTIIFLAAIAFVTATDPEYDLVPLDMPKMSKDPQELMAFVHCLLDKGPCTPLYRTYRDVAPDSVQTKCKRCSLYQRHCYWQFLQGLKALLPEDYVNYRQKYDPENKYFDDLESLLQNYAN